LIRLISSDFGTFVSVSRE